MAKHPKQRLDDVLASIAERPGPYGLDDSYAMFVAFVQGFDWGSNHQALDGLSSWLDDEVGPQRLAWDRHVLAVAFPGSDPSKFPVGHDHNRWAIDAAVVMLRRFLTDD